MQVWFAGVSGATCSWSTYSTLLATLDAAATVVPGRTQKTRIHVHSAHCLPCPLHAVGSYGQMLYHLLTLCLRALSICLYIGSTARVLGQMLRPLCPSGSTLCASYPYTTATNVTVAKPSTPLLPTPVLSYPAVISSCGSLTVDASSSTGSGGRYAKHATRALCVLRSAPLFMSV